MLVFRHTDASGPGLRRWVPTPFLENVWWIGIILKQRQLAFETHAVRRFLVDAVYLVICCVVALMLLVVEYRVAIMAKYHLSHIKLFNCAYQWRINFSLILPQILKICHCHKVLTALGSSPGNKLLLTCWWHNKVVGTRFKTDMFSLLLFCLVSSSGVIWSHNMVPLI